MVISNIKNKINSNIINLLEKRNYGIKYKIKDFEKSIDLICKSRLLNKDYGLYKYLIDKKQYEFYIFIDGLRYKKINLHSQEIQIYFINNIKKEYILVKKLNLNFFDGNKYYYYNNEGEQQWIDHHIIINSECIDLEDIDIYDNEIIETIINFKKWSKNLKRIIVYSILVLTLFFYIKA